MTNPYLTTDNQLLQKQADELAAINRQLLAAASNKQANDLLQEAESVVYSHLAQDAPTFVDLHDTLERHRQQAQKGYTIALFGRTGAGKSTLAAILTRSDTPVIGRGAQRTTRKTVEHRWENLKVLDTPGIAAAHRNGTKDSEAALGAADQADLIIFIASEDSPQPTEAQFLAELDRRGKKLIALMNCKQTIANPEDRSDFLNHPEEVFNEQDISDRQAQFEQMTAQYSSRPSPGFQPAHFQSMLESQRSSDFKESAALSAASRLTPILEHIQEEAAWHTRISAVKTPLDLLLPTLQDHGRELMQASLNARQNRDVVSTTIQEIENYLPNFKREALMEATNLISSQLNPLRNKIPDFAERNVENRNINQNWKRLCQRHIIESEVSALAEKWVTRLNQKAERIADNVAAAVEFNQVRSQWSFISKGKIFDWKRAFKWGSGATGIGISIIGTILAFSGPIGLAIMGLGAIVSLIGQLFGGKSKKEKLQEETAKIRASLNNNVDEVAKTYYAEISKSLNQLVAEFSRAIHQKLRKSEAELRKATATYQAAGAELRALCQNQHQQLAHHLLKLNSTESDLKAQIHAIGRVPGQVAILMAKPDNQWTESSQLRLQEALDEPIEVIAYTTNKKSILQQCLKQDDLAINLDPTNQVGFIPPGRLDVDKINRIHAAELLANLYIQQSPE